MTFCKECGTHFPNINFRCKSCKSSYYASIQRRYHKDTEKLSIEELRDN